MAVTKATEGANAALRELPVKGEVGGVAHSNPEAPEVLEVVR